MNILTVASRKGGVGKSTAAVHLAVALARAGRRVLVVDLDAQANATMMLTDPVEKPPPRTTADVLAGRLDLARVIQGTDIPGVMLAPGAKELTEATLYAQSRPGGTTMLRRSLKTRLSFDYLFIDTPPENVIAVTNALVASTHALVPFTPDAGALFGLAFVREAIDEIVSSGLNDGLKFIGSLQVAVDERVKLTEAARNDVRRAKAELFVSEIRTNSRFLRCVGEHRTIFDIERGAGGEHKGSSDYMDAATELERRIRGRRAA